MILAHAAQEAKIQRGRKRRVGLQKIFRLPPFVHHRVIKGLGYMLGNRLYHALVDREIAPRELLDCFLSSGVVGGTCRHERSYLYLSDRLKDARAGVDSKTDRF